MTTAAHRMIPVARLRFFAVACFALSIGGATGGCRGGGSDTLGLPDAYLLLAPARDKDGHAIRSARGLPLVQPVALDDPRAVPFHKMFGLGFGAELLRTDYLLKQFLRESSEAGKRFPPAVRASAAEPTVFILGSGPPLAGRGLATSGFFGGATDRPGVAWIALPDSPDSDPALAQTVSARLGQSIAATLAAAGAAEAGPTPPGGGVPAGLSGSTGPLPVLVAGYASAMEVIAREWRVGDGPLGTLALDAGTTAQRDLFAAVRQNRFVTTDAGGGRPQLRSAEEMLADPGVAATVLYRMAQSKRIGHRVAPVDLYAPFVTERVPNGISPAAVLGPFRNFQAKLIAVWGRAVLRGSPPRDIAGLVEAYAAALPAERSEAIRLFVVTTYGATVKPDGVSPAADATGALAELTALAAEVTAGRRPLRPALNAGK